jgi:putative sterol carrier protein
MSELKDSLESFAQSCNANERLMAMIKDWNRVLHIHAEDLDEHHALITNNGAVTVEAGAPSVADMTIRSTSEILTQIFYGEVSPNEPYNQGTLRIQGPEEDIVRLDFVIAMLWE